MAPGAVRHRNTFMHAAAAVSKHQCSAAAYCLLPCNLLAPHMIVQLSQGGRLTAANTFSLGSNAQLCEIARGLGACQAEQQIPGKALRWPRRRAGARPAGTSLMPLAQAAGGRERRAPP